MSLCVGASEFSGLRLWRFAGGVALSCSCDSGAVFSLLLDLFLLVLWVFLVVGVPWRGVSFFASGGASQQYSTSPTYGMVQ